MKTKIHPLPFSLLVHFLAAAMMLILINIPDSPVERYDVPIEVPAPIEAQSLKEVQKSVVLKSVNQPTPSSKQTREIFGANRNSYTDESVNENEGVSAKKGNTLTKVSDDTTLMDSDADSLPTPTEDYLVSEMPRIKNEVRPAYPESARIERLEGSVILDILIDESGNVRQANVVDGPSIFREGALAAIKRFQFYPAQVEGRAVAVRIRYTLKFELEY